MPVIAKLDEYGKGAWIALIILAFFIHWQLGFIVLAFAACSGRMRRWKMEQPGQWHNAPRGSRCGWGGGFGGWGRGPRTSGNRAFDDYRAETLKRLEDEQREFMEYLERLRKAKDKTEFDQFMADRRSRQMPEAPEAPTA